MQIVHTEEEEEETGVVLELWNASTKAIDAVRAAVCAPALNHQSGLGSPVEHGPRIAPGGTAKLHISNASSPSCDPVTPRVAAVVFEDGAAAGLPALIRRIKLEALGRIAESERIEALFEAAGDAQRGQADPPPLAARTGTALQAGYCGCR
ncbi:MAG: hypothetical protein C0504_07290 [Candidatus Solibacter sp.]|nr:hypothetical protein [Candidatus Solibacter sp.]